MRWFTMAPLTVVALVALGSAALAQGQTAAVDRSYVGQMTEEQIKQKLEGEGFSQVTEVKKVPVTKYRWTAKAMQAGKQKDVTIDELGHVSAK
jgi:hypothetical protein